MPTPLVLKYPLDPTGVNPANLVQGEIQVMAPRPVRAIALNYGAFFSASLVITDTANNTVLNSNQFYAAELYVMPTKMFGQEVCAVIVVTDQTVSNTVSITYQAVGGDFSMSTEAIVNMLNAVMLDTRPIAWPNIEQKPTQFPPSHHLHVLADLYGFEYVTFALERIRQAILQGDDVSNDQIYAYIDAHDAAITASQTQAIANAIAAHLAAANPHPQYLLLANANLYPLVITPTNESPINFALGVIPSVTFVGSTYYSLYGVAQAAAEFRLSTNVGCVAPFVFDVTVGAVIQYSDPTVLSSQTQYYWQCRYQDANSVWSAWSTPTSFTTAAVSVNIPSISGITNGELDVSQTPSLILSAFVTTGFTDTQVSTTWQIWSNNTATGIPVWSATTATGNLNAITVPGGALAIDQIYYLRAEQTGAALGASPWSAWVEFQTGLQGVNAPTITAPAENSTGVLPSPTLIATAFSPYGGTDTQQSASWEVWTYGTPIVSTLNYIDVTTWSPPSGVTTLTSVAGFGGPGSGTSAGASATAFGLTFTGGVGGAATGPTSTDTNVAVSSSTAYPINVPTGGSITANYTLSGTAHSVTFINGSTTFTPPSDIAVINSVSGFGGPAVSHPGTTTNVPETWQADATIGLGTGYSSTPTVNVTGSNIVSNPSVSVSLQPLYSYSGISVSSHIGTVPNGTYSVSGGNPGIGDYVAPSASVTVSGNAVTSATLTGTGLTANGGQNDAFFIIANVGTDYIILSSTASVLTSLKYATLTASGGTLNSSAALSAQVIGGGGPTVNESIGTAVLNAGGPVTGPTTYTAGVASTAFGETFPGGTSASAPPTVTDTNVAIVGGQQYTIVVPTGGSISVTYVSGNTGVLEWSSENNTTNLNSITLPIGELTNSTQYQARVMYTGNLYGNSPWSQWDTFTTGNFGINTPTLTSPANNSTLASTPITLTASPFSSFGTTDTQVSASWEVWTTATTPALVWSSENDTTHLTTINVPISTLTNNTQYKARVAQSGALLGTSSWSPWDMFTIDWPTGPVTLGESYGGGYFMGNMVVGSSAVAIIVGPKATSEMANEVLDVQNNNTPAAAFSTTNSFVDTGAWYSLGATRSTAAYYVKGLTVGGYSDWQIPALTVASIIAINANPIATQVPIYGVGGPEEFTNAWYWTATALNVPDTVSTYIPPTTNPPAAGHFSTSTFTEFEAYSVNFNTNVQSNDFTSESYYVRAVRFVPINASNSTTTAFNFNIAGGMNVNLINAAYAAGWNGVAPVVATVTANIGSTSATTPALVISGAFPNGVSLVINSGIYVVGAGGQGGTNTSIPGQQGGTAIQITTTNVSITNNGTIGGGGGGGADNGGVTGGGGGAGLVAAGATNGGAAGSLTTGGLGASNGSGPISGTGGDLGHPGTNALSGALGGAAGIAIVGSRNVTWTHEGTVLGALD